LFFATHSLTPMPRLFEEELTVLEQRSLLRKLREIESQPGTIVTVQGRQVLNFSSNDYLGLAGEQFMRDAAKRAIDEYGVGATASRLVCGNTTPHAMLESKLAEFKRTEAAVAFSSGYATAVGTLSALASRADVIILDKLAHASLIDGARLSNATIRVFPHNDLKKLESHLQWAKDEAPDARVFIVTESIFSMDGDRAPLVEIVALKQDYGALLVVDEAHAVGVIGDNGRGLVDKLGVTAHVDIQMGTLSKALGVAGGYICGKRKLIDLLINRARALIYSTAPPPALAMAACAAIDFMESPEGEARRRRLWGNLKVLAAGLPTGLTPEKIQSAIVPVMFGDEERALEAARWLLEKGFLVPAIRYPTVARGAARLRVTVSAAHMTDQIESLTEALRLMHEKSVEG